MKMTFKQKLDSARSVFERMDASQGVFFREQLTLIEAQLMEKKYPTKKGRLIVPQDRQGGAGALFRKWRMIDRVGVAKAIADYGDDLPMVSLTGKEFTATAKPYGIGYGWNESELEEAAMANMPLSSELANAARDGYEDTVDNLIFDGDEENGIQGLNNHPNIPLYSVGTGVGGNTWKLKTSAEILADIRALLGGMRALSKEVHQASLLVLPTEEYDILMTKPFGGDTDRPLVSYVRNAYPGLAIDSWYRLDGAGVGGANRAMAMQQDADVLYYWEPQSFTTYPVDKKNFKYTVPCKGKSGGVIVRRPFGIAFMDGL